MKKILIFCIFVILNGIIFCQNEIVNDSLPKLTQVADFNVCLVVPQYFEVDVAINGFQHQGSMATIQVQELSKVTISAFEKNMTPEYFETQGFTFKHKKQIILDNASNALLYYVGFQTDELEFERIMFFTENKENNKMIWINVNYPLIMKNLLEIAIDNCLKSVRSCK